MSLERNQPEAHCLWIFQLVCFVCFLINMHLNSFQPIFHRIPYLTPSLLPISPLLFHFNTASSATI